MLRFKPDFRWVFFNSQHLIFKCLKMQFVIMESSKWFYCQRGILKWLALPCFSFPLLSFFLENEFYSFFIENHIFNHFFQTFLSIIHFYFICLDPNLLLIVQSSEGQWQSFVEVEVMDLWSQMMKKVQYSCIFQSKFVNFSTFGYYDIDIIHRN